MNIIEKSENRKESDCATYKRCGGCSLRHMTYENTKTKKSIVQNLVNKGLKKKVEINETIGMEIHSLQKQSTISVGLNEQDNQNRGDLHKELILLFQYKNV